MTETPTTLIASPEDVDYERARRAHAHISHVPEQRAREYQQEYVRAVTFIYETLRAEIQPDQEARLRELMDQYRAEYLQHLYAIFDAMARTASAAVVGPAGFNSAQNAKRIAVEDKRRDEFMDWHLQAVTAIRRALGRDQDDRPIRDTDPDALERLQAQLAEREQLQERMKRANPLARKGDRAGLLAMGYTEADADKLIAGDFMGRKGFPAYALSNNNAEIARLKGRIKALEVRKPVQEERGEGWRIYEADGRICIALDARASVEQYDRLKDRGFRWSPTRSAWVRQSTAAALADARWIVQAE